MEIVEVSYIETGDPIFVRPAFDPTSTLDSAILATGAATVSWWRAHGVSASNETTSHVALAFRNSSGLFFVEAIPPAVTITPEASFWQRTSHATLYLGRLRDPSVRALGSLATRIASAQLGKPYASDFGRPPREFYCSSLVDYAYQHASGDKRIFVPIDFQLLWVPLPFWVDYYAKRGEPLPNTTGSNPTLLLHSPAIDFMRLHVGNAALRAWPGDSPRVKLPFGDIMGNRLPSGVSEFLGVPLAPQPPSFEPLGKAVLLNVTPTRF